MNIDYDRKYYEHASQQELAVSVVLYRRRGVAVKKRKNPNGAIILYSKTKQEDVTGMKLKKGQKLLNFRGVERYFSDERIFTPKNIDYYLKLADEMVGLDGVDQESESLLEEIRFE